MLTLYRYSIDEKIERQWRLVEAAFPPDRVIIVNDGDTLEGLDNLVVFSPEDADHCPGTIPLRDFEHPESATYFFGSDGRSMTRDLIGGASVPIVYIPSETELFSFHAALIALHDRRSRLSRQKKGNEKW
jgi:hypothetical protein